MRQCRPSRLRVPPRAHPLVRRLFAEMIRQRVSLSDLADRAGVARETISSWRYRRCPDLPNLDACFGALGYALWPMRQEWVRAEASSCRP
jgi:transcriptional regulator with XRE-family HTH domain